MYRQDESIYALIPPEEAVEQRPPMCAAPRRALSSRAPLHYDRRARLHRAL